MVHSSSLFMTICSIASMSAYIVLPTTLAMNGLRTFSKTTPPPVSRDRVIGSVALELTQTRRRTLCSRIAVIMFATAVEYRVIGLRLYLVPITERTACCPATAASTAIGSSASPWTTRSCSCWMGNAAA
jgi:hypothetical protein